MVAQAAIGPIGSGTLLQPYWSLVSPSTIRRAEAGGVGTSRYGTSEGGSKVAALSADDFIRKWKAVELKERSAAQEHFLDLCRLLDEPTPADADPTGTFYCFERGATKTSGGEGWADVWKRGHFGWEYKGKRSNLDAAFVQLQQYALALENPPLLVTCDMDRFVIRTNWTNSVSQIYELSLDDLRDAEKRSILKNVMSNPDVLRPGQTREELTQSAAGEFAELAHKLRTAGNYPPARVAHFVNRLIFCMYAEDADLLPDKMFSKMLRAARTDPSAFPTHASTLFHAMREGGHVGFDPIGWFNGGLFDDDEALPLDADDIDLCLRAASLDWRDIDPSIFGTLFVRGLDPDNREELGAEYTDRDKIMMIIRPVIIEPILSEWSQVREGIDALIEPAERALDEAVQSASAFPELAEEVRRVRARFKDKAQLELFGELQKQKRVRMLDAVRGSLRAAEKALTDAREQGQTAFAAFLARLRAVRVLDPACGSGNFLYLALAELKNLEWRVAIEAESMGFPKSFPAIGPEAVLGIEINPYAAELARVSVWIGEIQWMQRNGFNISRDPILKPLETIACRNAIINDDGSAAVWPDAEFIIGNPPYLGAKRMKGKLGAAQTDAIRRLYVGRLKPFTDLVCYWFENAREKIEQGGARLAGFVATNSIRKNTNLPVMRRIAATTRFYNAWPEEKWTVEGAAVDVSIVCFGEGGALPVHLNGEPVASINPDLTSGLDLTTTASLHENEGAAFLGIQKSGPFDVPGELARAWMNEPSNPNGQANAVVLKPYWNGDDVTGRPRDVWLIDLPAGLSKAEVAQFASPFNHVATTPDDDGKLVEELRRESGSEGETTPWWRPWRPRADMRSRIEGLKRYLVTPETAEHRLFAWLAFPILPDKNLIVIPRADDLMFGLLHNRFHEAWALRKGSDLQNRPRYTHTSTFATFPFPEGMTPNVAVADARSHPAARAIEDAAKSLNELRTNWLFPAELVRSEPESPRGYRQGATGKLVRFPARRVPINDDARRVLARRTLTALYNERPTWLSEAHRKLDEAVTVAYGWPPETSTGDALERLLGLNLARSQHS
jgi:type II restriction/modification system DNA methylase subunit YeeA